MTLEELQAKREEVLTRIGIARTTFGERSVEFTDAQKTLSVIDNEIDKLTAVTQTGPSRTTYAVFRKGPRPGFSE